MNRRKALKYVAITGPTLVLAIKKEKHIPRIVDFRKPYPSEFKPAWLRRFNTRLVPFLNGKEITRKEKCFYSNEATGEIQCFKTDENGRFYHECDHGCERNSLGNSGWHTYKSGDKKHEIWAARHPVQRGKVEIRII